MLRTPQSRRYSAHMSLRRIAAGALAELRGGSRYTPTRQVARLAEAEQRDGRRRIWLIGRKRMATIKVLRSEGLLTPTTAEIGKNFSRRLRDLEEELESLRCSRTAKARDLSERSQNAWAPR